MKRTASIFFSVVMVLGLATSALAAEGKIGYVDLSRLFDEYYKTKAYDKVLEKEHKTFEKERMSKVDEIKEAQGKLSLLTEDKKKELEDEIASKKEALMAFDRRMKADLTKKRNEKIREILLEIEKVVSDYAEKEGYAIILNDRVLIYGTPKTDLTEPILKILNSNQPKAE